MPDNMDRVVNITVSPEVLKTMLEQQQTEEMRFAHHTGQGWLLSSEINWLSYCCF